MMTMKRSLITSSDAPTLSESKIGHLKDLLTPALRHVLNDKKAQVIIENGDWFQIGIQAMLDKMLSDLTAKTESFAVTVDYTKSIAEMIKAGKYHHVDRNIKDMDIPVNEEGKVGVEILIIDFRCRTFTLPIFQQWMDDFNLRAATLPELLALGETFPEVQKRYPIVAFGTIWQEATVPCLHAEGNKRELLEAIYSRTREWNRGYRFAFVRK
jgi:hypothetical protein